MQITKREKSNILEIISKGRMVSTPLVFVETQDQVSFMHQVVNHDLFQDTLNNPRLSWDCIRGFQPLDAATELWMQSCPVFQAEVEDNPELKYEAVSSFVNYYKPEEAISVCANFPPKTLIFVINAHRFLDRFYKDMPKVTTALNLIRGKLKENHRMIICLAPEADIPIELNQDFLVLRDSFPDEDQSTVSINKVINEAIDNSETPFTVSNEDRHRVVNSLRCFTKFKSEQLVANSLTDKGVDFNRLWDLLEDAINGVKGLKLERGNFTFNDVGGLWGFKQYIDDIMHGEEPPDYIVRCEELEKAISGAINNGDNTGTAQAMLENLLTFMEDGGHSGIILTGIQGGGKSFCSLTAGPTYGLPTITQRIGDVRTKEYGEPEKAFKLQLDTLSALGKRILFLSSSNGLDGQIPPPLLRRYRDGIYYFDINSPEEKYMIWYINLLRYGIIKEKVSPGNIPSLVLKHVTKQVFDLPYISSDIRDVSEKAYKFRRTVPEVYLRHTPVYKTDLRGILRTRAMAHNRFISATTGQLYQMGDNMDILSHFTTQEKELDITDYSYSPMSN